jgi:hypothetical protein
MLESPEFWSKRALCHPSAQVAGLGLARDDAGIHR